MIKEKQRLTGNLNTKQSLSGKLGNKIIYVDPLTQEKSVEPSKLKQVIVPDDGFNGLSKVIVNKIAENYVIPTGEIEIKENGTYDVKEKESAIVNIPEKVLGVKSITSNGTYKASDDNLDGYSQVDVNVSADVNWDEYYTNPLTASGNPSTSSASFFNSIIRSIKKIPNDVTINSYRSLCYGCYNLLDVDFLIGKTLGNDCSQMLQFCEKLTTIPQLDTSNVINMNTMFSGCISLQAIPLLDTSKVTSMGSLFSYCYKLGSIPLLNTHNVNHMYSMFYSCTSLTTVPQLDTSNATNMSEMFRNCTSLTTVPQLDTSNATNMSGMFNNCTKLTTVPQLNARKVITVSNIFSYCTGLTTFGGLENLGQAYSTTYAANNSNYTLILSACTKLTEQSIINVLNNLYDIATKGCKAQKVVLGATNLAKLTSEEGQTALTNAQAKGWTIS